MTAAEIEAGFVAGKSAKRQQIWADWTELTAALREIVSPVPAAWMSGSFFTDVDEPGDIDCVYVIEWTVFKAALITPDRADFVQAVANCQVKSLFGLSVDSFILEWWPTSGPTPPTWARGTVNAEATGTTCGLGNARRICARILSRPADMWR